MKKIRISYSLLNLWRMGRYEEAIVSYFHLGQITNEAIEAGRLWDSIIKENVESHKKLPAEFGGEELKLPIPQMKLMVNYNDQFSLTGVLDIYDKETKTIYETKTGVRDSGSYANDFQVSIYFLLLGLSEIPADKAYILHYNQHEKTFDKTLIWKSKQEIERARNFIDSIGPEIYEYFEKHKLFERKSTKKDVGYNQKIERIV